jgi:hypothetical protein
VIERAVVDRAQTEPVRNDRRALLLEIADDVRGVEKPQFFETADSALVVVRGEDEAAEASLMHPAPDLTIHIPAFDEVVRWQGLLLIERPDPLAH